MTTLREEIHDQLLLAVNDVYIDPSNVVKLRDEILKLFEKMIDEKIQRYKNISFNDTVIKRACLEELKEQLKK